MRIAVFNAQRREAVRDIATVVGVEGVKYFGREAIQEGCNRLQNGEAISNPVPQEPHNTHQVIQVEQ